MSDRIKLALIFVMIAVFCFVNFAIVTNLFGHDLPRDDDVGLVQWTPSRPNISMGFGSIIDDVESMSSGLGWDGRPHTMRNKRDPGNWVHEMTHLVNAEFRSIMEAKERRPYNSAYVLGRFACSLPEPKVTLTQIAAMVPKDKQVGGYKNYLVDSRRWWNKQPLYVLDEASAAAAALWYHVKNKKVDNTRERLMREWINYSIVMVAAVERFDPTYPKLDKLRAFVMWHNRRGRHLIQHHKRLTSPYFIGEAK